MSDWCTLTAGGSAIRLRKSEVILYRKALDLEGGKTTLHFSDGKLLFVDESSEEVKKILEELEYGGPR